MGTMSIGWNDVVSDWGKDSAEEMGDLFNGLAHCWGGRTVSPGGVIDPASSVWRVLLTVVSVVLFPITLIGALFAQIYYAESKTRLTETLELSAPATPDAIQKILFMTRYRPFLENEGVMAWLGSKTVDNLLTITGAGCRTDYGGDGTFADEDRVVWFSAERAAEYVTGMRHGNIDVLVTLNCDVPFAGPRSALRTGLAIHLPDLCVAEETEQLTADEEQERSRVFANGLVEAARFMYRHYQAGRKVAAHCTEGRNRCALAAALVHGAISNATFAEIRALCRGSRFIPHPQNRELVEREWVRMVHAVRSGEAYVYGG